MQPAEQRRHDAREAIAAGDALQQAVLHADDLNHPGQPGKAARQRQRERLVERAH